MSINESYLWTRRRDDGRRRRRRPRREGKDTPSRISGGTFTPDGKGVYDDDRPRRRVQAPRLRTRPREPHDSSRWPPSIKWDVEEFELSPDGKTHRVRDQRGRRRRAAPARHRRARKELPRPKLPPGSVSGLKWHPQRPRPRRSTCRRPSSPTRRLLARRRRPARSSAGPRARPAA